MKCRKQKKITKSRTVKEGRKKGKKKKKDEIKSATTSKRHLHGI